MDDKWNKLKEFVNKIYDDSYEDSVWTTCENILDKMNDLESEEL